MAARRREADGSEAIDGADSAIRWCGHGRGVALVRLGEGRKRLDRGVKIDVLCEDQTREQRRQGWKGIR